MKKSIQAIIILIIVAAFCIALPSCSNDEKNWDISKFPGTVLSGDIDDYDCLEFEPGDIEDIQAAIIDYCNNMYGNRNGYVNREILIEYKESNGYEYIFHTYEIYDGVKNYLTEYKVSHYSENLDTMTLSDLGSPIQRPQDDIDDEIVSALLTRTADHLEEKYPKNRYIPSYSGWGWHKVYINGFTYYEISIYDQKKDKNLGYLVLSEESDTAYRRINKSDYIEYQINS